MNWGEILLKRAVGNGVLQMKINKNSIRREEGRRDGGNSCVKYVNKIIITNHF